MIVFFLIYIKNPKQKKNCIIFLSPNQKRIIKHYLIFKRVFDDEHDTKIYLINKRSVKLVFIRNVNFLY